MLRTSEVARKLNISNEQVMTLVDYGFLKVADLERIDQGFAYLFAEEEVNRLEVGSCLAEMEQMRREHRNPRRPDRFTSELRAVRRYDRFLNSIEETVCPELLLAAFYLFHLNHYAKKYRQFQDDLYNLKHRVLKRMTERYGLFIELTQLIGSDRCRVWLCEDCRINAREQGITYRQYIKEGFCCPNCEQQVIERDYYSLLEITIKVGEHRFCFHVPLNQTRKWDQDWERIPRRERGSDDNRDRMYIYGRQVNRTEERIYPLPVVITALEQFLEQ